MAARTKTLLIYIPTSSIFPPAFLSFFAAVVVAYVFDIFPSFFISIPRLFHDTKNIALFFAVSKWKGKLQFFRKKSFSAHLMPISPPIWALIK